MADFDLAVATHRPVDRWISTRSLPAPLFWRSLFFGAQ